jgi:hypothetical protein
MCKVLQPRISSEKDKNCNYIADTSSILNSQKIHIDQLLNIFTSINI